MSDNLATLAFACIGQGDRPLDRLAAQLEPDCQIVYKSVGDRQLRLHVFRPDGYRPTDRRPAFVTFHGGGWTGRDPRYFYPFARYFAELGMVGISVEYRLMNRDQGITVFDCCRDARSAVRYLRANAASLGIAPDRLVVSGGSAGAHLAAGTALFAGLDEPGDDPALSCRPDLLALYYPVIDTSEAGYGQGKIGERWRDLSPVDQVVPGLPPTLLLHGTADTVTPFAGAVRFHQRMLAAGNVCDFVVHEGGKHGYFIFDMPLFLDAMARTADFLRRHGLLPAESPG